MITLHEINAAILAFEEKHGRKPGEIVMHPAALTALTAELRFVPQTPRADLVQTPEEPMTPFTTIFGIPLRLDPRVPPSDAYIHGDEGEMLIGKQETR